jgi:hypothetical protein
MIRPRSLTPTDQTLLEKILITDRGGVEGFRLEGFSSATSLSFPSAANGIYCTGSAAHQLRHLWGEVGPKVVQSCDSQESISRIELNRTGQILWFVIVVYLKTFIAQ